MSKLRYLMAGVFMGFAELIPGVSGSTIALLFRVYEHIIISARALTSFGFWQNPIHEFKKYDLLSICVLMLSMALGVLLFSNAIVYIFENYSEVFNTVIGVTMLVISAYIVYRATNRELSLNLLVTLVVGLLFGYILGNFNFSSSEISIITLILAGVIAFSFFIVPGISGSAILVALGFYELIIKAISELNLEILIPFGFGCLISLIVLPRVILSIYSNYKSSLDMFFAGLILISGILLF
jgi:putative membrane protein